MRVIVGECAEVMAAMPEASVDAIVCDPPYGIGFMGRGWDTFDPRTMEQRVGRPPLRAPVVNIRRRPVVLAARSAFANPAGEAGAYDFSPSGNARFQAWCEAWGSEALRVLKPGGHLLAFGGTRTYHRLTCGLEDAGFEIRDCLVWLYGSGFPKSLDVSKAIDKAAGAEREVVGPDPHWRARAHTDAVYDGGFRRPENLTAPATPEAAQWDGWGTALKPAHEPIVLARRPLVGTVAANVQAHGTGALNIDGCRIEGAVDPRATPPVPRASTENWRIKPGLGTTRPEGRWPANVALDEEAAAMLDEQSGTLTSGANPTRRGSDKFRDVYGDFAGQEECEPLRGAESGGASRFFYCAKADTRERNAGLGGDGGLFADPDAPDRNDHPTVKPIGLMRWLVRLVTPPGGLVLDPFCGSGTTGCAAALEGFGFIGIEQDEGHARIARARIAHWSLGAVA